MASMKILTGYTGTSHITPELDADVNISIFGSENVVLNFGKKLAISSSDRHAIIVDTGAVCFSGRVAVQMYQEALTIDRTMSDGKYSRCKIVARYVKDEVEHESITLKLIQSNSDETSVSKAQNLTVIVAESDDIRDGENVADFELYDFVITDTGIVQETLSKKFNVIESIVSLTDDLNSKNEKTIEDISAVNERIGVAEGRITTTETDVKINENEIIKNRTNISTLGTNITAVDTKARNLEYDLDKLSTRVSNNKDTLEEMINDRELKRIPFNKSSTTYQEYVEYIISPENLSDTIYILLKHGRYYVTIPVFSHYMDTTASGGVGVSGGVFLRGAFSEGLYAQVNVYGGSHSTSGSPYDNVSFGSLQIRVHKNVALGRKSALSVLDFYTTDDYPELIAVFGMNYS